MVALPPCPRECGDPSHPHPISPVATPRPSLPCPRKRGPIPTHSTHAHLSRGTHTANPSCPRECGDPSPTNSAHAHLSRGRRTRRHPSCPRECGDPSPHPFRYSRESRNPAPDPMTERLHKTSPSVITNTPSATTMKIAPHTSPRRGNPLWLPSPNSYTFHSEQSEAKSKNLKRSIQRRIGWN